jgi:hypothetical protein
VLLKIEKMFALRFIGISPLGHFFPLVRANARAIDLEVCEREATSSS